MESRTIIRNIRISPKKLRFLLEDIKRHKPSEALKKLDYTRERGGNIFYKAIQSAVASAKIKLKVQDANLVFKTLSVEQGPKLKRFQAGGRGVVKSFARRFSHIRIILASEETKPEMVKPEQEAPKKLSAAEAEKQVLQRPSASKVANVKK